MHLIAILLVMTAGIMWAGCGLAAQDFFKKYTRLDGSDGLPHVLCERHHAACDHCQRTAERQLAEAGATAISLVGTDLLRYSRSDADALYLLCFDRRWQCGSGNGHPIYLSGDGDPLGLLAKRRLPLTGELTAVVLAIIGVLLLVTGGDVSRLSVPADCVYLGLASAVFFAICCVFPKRFIGVLDNSFVLALGMFIGAVASYIINPMGDFSGFFAPEVRFDIFWIVVLGTALSFTCYNAGLRFLPASQASVTATIEPAISVIASYFIFHTHFNFVQGFGILLVLLAIAVPGIIENENTAGE